MLDIKNGRQPQLDNTSFRGWKAASGWASWRLPASCRWSTHVGRAARCTEDGGIAPRGPGHNRRRICLQWRNRRNPPARDSAVVTACRAGRLHAGEPDAGPRGGCGSRAGWCRYRQCRRQQRRSVPERRAARGSRLPIRTTRSGSRNWSNGRSQSLPASTAPAPDRRERRTRRSVPR